MKRNHNEDKFAVLDDDRLYMVADGMGGHASGEVASQMAVTTVSEFYRSTAEDEDATWPYKMDRAKGYQENRLITGFKLANLRIHQAAMGQPGLRGMGTTLVAISVINEGILVGHVGDSRVYRYRDRRLTQLTEDHSLLNDYIKMKRLSDEEIANFPHKNVIVRALGMKSSIKVDTRLDEPCSGDIYLLCSDGLCGPVTDEEIAQVLAEGTDLKSTCSTLIDRANAHGGPDNITVVVAKVIGAS